jgi:hypothetical protein
MSEERRSHPRIELVAQAEVEASDVMHLLRVVNASRGGVFLQATPSNYPDFREGVQVQLHLIPDADDEDEVRATGKIVRIQSDGDDPGFAIEFTSIDADQAKVLEALLASVT